MVSAERLKEVLHYDPNTGLFTWKVSTRRKPAGSIAGSIDGKGYKRINIDRKEYRAHRLAWLYIHGSWPNGEIDHVDQNKTNNSIKNLRVASHTQNQWNYGKRLHNTSGYKGVSWIKRDKRWQAQIKINGRSTHLGLFKDPELAHAAYLNAAIQLHGDFFNET